MVAVHPLQVKEPSATVSQMSSLGSSSVGVDSILVEPTTSGASNKSTNTFWYFAIGSMMSPKSMENRNIVPLTSAPAELFDYELKFFGGMGFGEAVNKPGASFHGVLVSYRTYILHCYLCIFSMVYAPDIFSHYLRDFLHSLLVHSFMSTRTIVQHLVDTETMERLDKIEISYKRVHGQARMYDGTTVTATVYTKAGTFGQENNPPHERYLDIMIEGAKHFNVHPDHITFLKNHECQPRPKPNEFNTFGEPDVDGPVLSYEDDVLPYNGCTSSSIVRLTVNGKVIEICTKEVKDPLFHKTLHFYTQYGQRIEIVYSKMLYDPRYGCPDKIEVSDIMCTVGILSLYFMFLHVLTRCHTVPGLYTRTLSVYRAYGTHYFSSS